MEFLLQVKDALLVVGCGGYSIAISFLLGVFLVGCLLLGGSALDLTLAVYLLTINITTAHTPTIITPPSSTINPPHNLPHALQLPALLPQQCLIPLQFLPQPHNRHGILSQHLPKPPGVILLRHVDLLMHEFHEIVHEVLVGLFVV